MGYNLALFGIRWYWVSIGLLSLYMLNKSEILSGVIAGQQTTNKQGKIELLSQYGPWKAEMSKKVIPAHPCVSVTPTKFVTHLTNALDVKKVGTD